MEGKKKRGMSIRIKLIAAIIPIVIAIVIVCFILSCRAVLNLSKESLYFLAKSYVNDMNAWTERIFAEIEVYKDNLEQTGFESDEEILKYIKSTVNRNEAYPLGVYIGDNGGGYLDGAGWIPDEDWKVTERDWYLEGRENEKLTLGEPYYDSATGKLCVSASVRMNDKNRIRVMAADIYLSHLSTIIEKASQENGVQALLVTEDTQMIVAHEDPSMISRTLGNGGMKPLYAKIGEAMKTGERGVFSHENYLCSLLPVEHTDWVLAVCLSEKEALRDMYIMGNYMVVIAVIAALILIVVIIRLMDNVVKPVSKVTGVISQIAQGDFTQEIEVRGNDEVAHMSRDMHEFIVQMRETIVEIKQIVDWLDGQSKENLEISDSLMFSSKEQEQAMQVLTRMVTRLENAAQEVNERMGELSGLINQTRLEGECAGSLMKESVILSQDGKDNMDSINRGMEYIDSSITTLSKQMEKVGEAVAQIENMVNIIIDIAEETNLLSLNASIEAVRAGDAGRGFNIVAEQIGKLAANSSIAADDISGFTATISTTVATAVEYMRNSVEEVKKNVIMVTEASTTFAGLYEKVEETGRRVDHMIELVGEVNLVADDMVRTTSDQIVASEQISESAKTLDQHTSKVISASTQVAKSAQGLKSESEKLADQISKFRLQ